MNGVLNKVVSNGGELGDCDVPGTLGALVGIIKGDEPPTGVNYCSLLDLQTVINQQTKDVANNTIAPRLRAGLNVLGQVQIADAFEALTEPNPAPATGIKPEPVDPGKCAPVTKTKQGTFNPSWSVRGES